MSEFSDRPFAVGSLFGIRSFRVTGEGVLTGVNMRLPWHDGINDAECARPLDTLAMLAASSAWASISMARLGWEMEWVSAQMLGRVLLKKRPKPPPRQAPPEPTPRPTHQAGTLQCSCGFYAYFDRGYNPHHHSGNMLAIVEGFGIATVGSRGFRSSKARIRALIVEDFEQGFALAKVMPNYPGVRVFGSIDDALAEFPLSPKPEGTSEPLPDLPLTFTITARDMASATLRRIWIIGQTFPRPTSDDDETPQERALRLRRERNTGPADPRGLDGHHRRTR